MINIVEIRTAKGWEIQLETTDEDEAFKLVRSYSDDTEWRLTHEQQPVDVVIDLHQHIRRSANARTPIAAAMVAAVATPQGGTA